jgi:predicted phage terminase large subunit-like protein
VSIDVWEFAARMFEPQSLRYDSPLTMATSLDDKVLRTPALDLINSELVDALNTNDGRLTVAMSPQEGKSMLVSRRFPLWVLLQNPETRIAIVSYEHNVARRLSRAIRDDIIMHPELGLKIRDDLSAQHEWQLDGHQGGVYSVGVGGALTGRPVDLLILDDVLKDREQADSPTYRERAYSWWTDVGATRLSPGAPVVVVATRWHESDLTGQLLAAEDANLWKNISIPAQADHRPERGETDPLDREPGEFMISARGRTVKQWEAIKVRSGPRTWASLYQGRPSPDEGGVFPPEWARYNQKLWTERDDGVCMVPGIGRDDHEMAISADLAFRDTTTSDYVVIQVWLRVGVNAYLLDQIRRRMNFNDTLLAIKAISAKWPQAVQKFIEAKANGDAAINALSRDLVGLIPIEPEGSKHARASAVSPLAFSGNIILPTASILPNVEDLIEEAKNFPSGAHDDTIDALSQVINRLLLMPLLAQDQVVVNHDVYDDYDDRGFLFSPV